MPVNGTGSRRPSPVSTADDPGPKAWMGWPTAPGWPLLPLRLFLGVTFTYAGLQKLANPAFLTGSGPTSIRAQMAGAMRHSPIHGILAGLIHISTAVGVVIAVGEVAVGLGTLVGLWTRLAAAGGMAISVGLFFTVSFHSSPYFTGSDIVFFFAWTPLVLAGAGGAPALDTWFLTTGAAAAGPGSGGALSRRQVVSRGAAAAGVAALAIVAGGVTALLGRLIGDSGPSPAAVAFGSGSTTTATTPPSTTAPVAPSTSTSTTAAPPASTPPGKKLGSASEVPVGGSATFSDPATGDPGLVIQGTAGRFVAFDAVCPHAGCTVAYQRGAKIIACPCHGSEFNAQTGAVETGPASQNLQSIRVQLGSDGNLYVDG